MLHFFRRIRQKLIESGSITKYLLYATGEILLVVVGILIALQVNNWNEARKDREKERNYIARLHAEVIEAEASRIGNLESVTKRVADAKAMTAVVFGERDAASLDASVCTSMARLGIFYLEGYTLPTLDELMATGNLDVIRDAPLRGALTRYQSFAKAQESRLSAIHIDKPDLSRLYPEFIRVYPVSAGVFQRMAAECNFDAIPDDPLFANDLIDLTARASFFQISALEPEQNHIDDIHAALDAILGIKHSTEKQ